MASSSRPGGMDISSGLSRCPIVQALPWMCALLVIGIEAWQKGLVFGLLVGLGGLVMLGLLSFGLRLYNEAGSLPGPSLTKEYLQDMIGLEEHKSEIRSFPLAWRNVNGTAVLRF